MEILLAIVHIVGSFLIHEIMGLCFLLWVAWENKRKLKSVSLDIANSLGISVEDLKDESLAPQFIKISAERYSDELLRNRISDLVGSFLVVFIWLMNILPIIFLLAVIWFTLTNDVINARYAWFILLVDFICYCIFVLVLYLCLLLTGRHPHEAKKGREVNAEMIEELKAENKINVT